MPGTWGGARDTRKHRLYAAERDAFSSESPLTMSAAAKRCLIYDARAEVVDFCPSIQSAQAYVDAVRTSAAFRRRWGHVTLTVDGNHGRTSRGGWGGLYLSPIHRRNEAVILHEITHCLVSPSIYAAHGPEFAAVFLELVKIVMGREAAASLRAAYSVRGVKYRTGLRVVPKPSESRLARAKRVKVKRAKPGKAFTPEQIAASREKRVVPLTYEDCYNSGWRTRSAADPSLRMQSRPGFDLNAWEDGYLDAAAGRDKWHRRDCKAHHNIDGGCGVA